LIIFVLWSLQLRGSAVDVVRFERRNEGCKDQLAFWHWNKQQRIELSPATTVTLTPKTLVWDGSNNSQMMSKYYEAAVAAASCHCPSRHHPFRLSKFWDKRGNKRNNCRQWKDMQIDWDGRPSGWSWLPLYEFDDNDVAVWLAKYLLWGPFLCVAVGLPMCRAAIGLPVHQGNGCLCIQKWEIPSLRRNKNKCTSLVMYCETIVSLQDNSNWRVAEVIYTSPSSLPPKLSCRGTPHKIDLHDGINNTLIKNQWYICNDAPRCVQPIWSFHKLLLNQKSTPFDVHIVGWRRRGRGCITANQKLGRLLVF